MKTADRIRFRGHVRNRNEASAYLERPGDAVLVERGRPRLLVISCPCGCGEQFPINLDARAGPAWRLYREARRGLSVFPSVWRESGCESHYVIWRDRIYLFGRYDEDFASTAQSEEFANLIDMVSIRLRVDRLISYSDIAEIIDAVPWDVLTACRHLVKMGLAREGKGKERGSFKCL
jgi:hypothetical protein